MIAFVYSGMSWSSISQRSEKAAFILEFWFWGMLKLNWSNWSINQPTPFFLLLDGVNICLQLYTISTTYITLQVVQIKDEPLIRKNWRVAVYFYCASNLFPEIIPQIFVLQPSQAYSNLGDFATRKCVERTLCRKILMGQTEKKNHILHTWAARWQQRN